MGFFKKDKKKTEDNVDVDSKTSSKTSKAEFKIVIKEKFSKGTTTLKTITAKREIDPDDHVVYLANVQQKFLELMPTDEVDFEKLDKKVIEKRLENARKLLNGDDTLEDGNRMNYRYDVMKYEAQLRALDYEKDNTYITIDEHGVKTFYFLREGSRFFPMKWDTDTKTIYTANENVKKKAGLARRNKSIKYSKFKNVIEGSVMFMMILNIVMSCALGYIGLKTFQKLDESAIVEAQNFCVQKGAEWTQIVQKNAEATEKIVENLQSMTAKENPFLANIVPAEIGGKKE